MYRLTCQMLAPVSVEEAFRVFENPYNLGRITPHWLGFQVLTDDVQMRTGAEIHYRIRWMRLPVRWMTRITAYDPPRFFVDEQIRGPYTLWRHRHTFEADPAGTRVADEVLYELPLGVLGRAVHSLVVDRQLRQIFEFRQQALQMLIGGEPGRYRTSGVRIEWVESIARAR